MAEDYVPFLRHGSTRDREGNGRHEGLSFVAGLYGGIRVRKTVELCPHGGNGCVDSVDVVCCGTVCLASDKTSYVPHGVSVGAADAERACLLWQAAGRVRCGVFVEGGHTAAVAVDWRHA